MTLHHVLASIYKEIVKAQHDAYDYAKGLQEQASDSLFPIPIAKATDVTLAIHYAHAEAIDKVAKDTLNTPLFKKALSRETHHIIQEGIQVFFQYIETNHKIKPEEIPLIKKTLASGKLTTYLVTQIIQRMDNEYQLLTEAGLFNEEAYIAIVNSCFQNEVVRHRDIQTLTVGDRELILRKLDVILQDTLPQIHTSFEASMCESEVTQHIITDAQQLKGLPKEAIQQLTVTMKVDELLNIDVTN